MAWRLAESLVVLRDEVRTLHPGTTVWTIGDEAHRDTWSDHNPNECCDVVCAADILDNAGLDLAWFVDTITTTDPPALKYVIYRDRIYIAYMQSWQPYRGTWHGHVHVSVGEGPDGQSTGPYDDTSPWGLAGGGNPLLGLKKGDQGEPVEALQAVLRYAGFAAEVGEVDGVYGDMTSAGVLAARKSQGSSATSGDRVDKWAYAQILAALAERKGGGGEDGEDGRPPTAAEIADAVAAWLEEHRDELRGEDGKDGLTPTHVQITGEVTATK